MSTYKLADWAAKNKNLIIAATAVTFVGGAAASYYYSSAAIAPATASASTQKKKKKSKKSKKSSTDAPSPLLEELSPQDRDSVAQDFKSKGNKQYQQHQWNEAAINYSKAIESSTKPEAVFYSNRAACYNNLGDYNKVIDDCNEALKLDSEYVKALNRRAQAFEQLGNLNDALNDFTAATIIDQFRNDSAAKSVERVLKKLAETQAKSVLQVSYFIHSYTPHSPHSSSSLAVKNFLKSLSSRLTSTLLENALLLPFLKAPVQVTWISQTLSKLQTLKTSI